MKFRLTFVCKWLYKCLQYKFLAGTENFFRRLQRKPAGGRSLLHATCYLAGSGTTNVTQHQWKQQLRTKFVYDHWRSADSAPFLYLFVHDLVTLIHFINILLINGEGSQN